MKKHFYLILCLALSLQAFSQEEPAHHDDKVIEKDPFSSITERFTLVLTGYFDDCGEFGGHRETIELIRIDRKLMAILTIYGRNCQSDNRKKPKVIKSNTYPIDDNQVVAFQNYLKKLLAKSLKLSYGYHAGRQYSARLDYREQYDDDKRSFERLNIVYNDNDSAWTEFQSLISIIKK